MAKIKKVIIVLILFSVILVGCSKVTRDNYVKIKPGMNYEQVVNVLGQPDKCDGAFGMKNCVWGNKQKNITIKFIAEKVVLPTMKGL